MLKHVDNGNDRWIGTDTVLLIELNNKIFGLARRIE